MACALLTAAATTEPPPAIKPVQWPPKFQTFEEYMSEIEEAREHPGFRTWLDDHRNIECVMGEMNAAMKRAFDQRSTYVKDARGSTGHYLPIKKPAMAHVTEWQRYEERYLYSPTTKNPLWTHTVEELKALYVQEETLRLREEHAKTAFAAKHLQEHRTTYNRLQREHDETKSTFDAALGQGLICRVPDANARPEDCQVHPDCAYEAEPVRDSRLLERTALREINKPVEKRVLVRLMRGEVVYP